MNEPLRFGVRDGVATLTLDDPARMNAMSPAMLDASLAALDRVHEDRSVRVLVLAARGRAFCAGADLSAVRGAQADAAGGAAAIDDRVGARIHEQGNRLIAALRNAPVPTVCAVGGVAAGGGVALALACDVTLAARSAYFYMPFVPALGILPDLGSAWFMLRAAGRARALASSLLGNRISAEQAAQWGLIWACVDDAALDTECSQVAARLALLSPQAVVETRALLEVAQTSTLDAQLAYERERQPRLIESGAFAEGVRAFLGKRRAVFGGR